MTTEFQVISNETRTGLIEMFNRQNDAKKEFGIRLIKIGVGMGDIDFLDGDYEVVASCAVAENDNRLRFWWNDNATQEVPRGEMYIPLERIGVEVYFAKAK